MQGRIATLSLIALMVVALLLAARWQGPGRSKASGQLKAASAGVAHVANSAPPITLDPDRAPTPAELDDAVWEKLQKPISVSFAATPLADAVAYLADAIGTQTYLDMRALGDEGIDPNQATVTSELTNLPAEIVLDVVLRQLNLDYRLRDGAMIVTTASDAEQQTKVRTYSIGELVGHQYGWAVELIEAIRYTVGPYSWDEQGGLGSLDYFDGSLVVTQTDKVHRQIQHLLRQLRSAQRIAPASEPRVPLTPAELDDAVWQKLQKPISVSFEATPLTDVLAFIADAIGTQTYLDLRALEDAAIPPDAPVTIELTHLPAEMVLDVILEQVDLDYCLNAGAMIVTTASEAEQQTKVRTYPISDLVGQDYDLVFELIEIIPETIDPASWSFHGGPGNIAPFDKTLVVTQTDKVHRQIQLLLQQLRSAQRIAPGMP